MAGMRPPSPIGFAHRGARAERPDNTLASFARAVELGATGLETDAWLSADGVVVLHHDGWFRRGWRRWPVRAIPRRQLPPSVPSLAELYASCGVALELSVDVKDPDVAAPLLEEARIAAASEHLWLCSAHLSQLVAWRALDARAHLVHSTTWRAIPPSGRDRPDDAMAEHARRLADAGVDALNLHHESWTASRVERVHANGRAAFGWDAQSAAAIERLLDLGVDGVYSDHVGRLMAAIAKGHA